jgi:LytS/YehU family sensor histidine kinase
MVDTELEIEVENPRPTETDARQSASGVGLENTARRLELLFGARASICLELSDARRAKATARLPA